MRWVKKCSIKIITMTRRKHNIGTTGKLFKAIGINRENSKEDKEPQLGRHLKKRESDSEIVDRYYYKIYMKHKTLSLSLQNHKFPHPPVSRVKFVSEKQTTVSKH
uniref:Uncharacterized protein n=1 Tax=Cacopsylla melanoneura TaxID=428564 RepID=A0A8D8V9C9_9HEMI